MVTNDPDVGGFGMGLPIGSVDDGECWCDDCYRARVRQDIDYYPCPACDSKLPPAEDGVTCVECGVPFPDPSDAADESDSTFPGPCEPPELGPLDFLDP